MAHSGTLGHPLTPPRSGAELRRGALVALAVHGILFAALTVNIPWTPPPPKVVAAELWSAMPQSAPLPAAAEPVTPPTEPPPEVQPPPTPAAPPAKPAPPEPQVAPKIPDKRADAQIAIEKEKKARAEKEKAEKAEKAERAEKARLEKVAKEKADKEKAEKAEKEKLEKDKLAREKAQKIEKAEAQKRAAAEEARVAKMREDQIARTKALLEGSGGVTASDAAPSAKYQGILQRILFANIQRPVGLKGQPRVEVEITLAPNGSVMSVRATQPSANANWDKAVVEGIWKAAKFPPDETGKVWPKLYLGVAAEDTK